MAIPFQTDGEQEYTIMISKPIKKAIFPVGGLGTRFLPATKAMPKEMLPIIDKPLIQYAVEEARDAGIEDFIFITGRGKGVIEDHFDHTYELSQYLKRHNKIDVLHTIEDIVFRPGQIVFLRQQQPRGLGHAVWCARHLIKDEPFAVLLADDFILGNPSCLKQMINAHIPGTNMAAVMEVPKSETNRYGILDIDRIEKNLIHTKSLVEKPTTKEAPSTHAIVGRYILQSSIFSVLEKQDTGKGGEIQLTDAIREMISSIPFMGLLFEGERFDCGSKLGMLEAILAAAFMREDIKGPMTKLLDQYVNPQKRKSL